MVDTTAIDTPLHVLSVADAAARIREGRLSSRLLVEACLRRIEVLDPAIQAWVLVDRAGALDAATRLDAEAAQPSARGPLHGIPVGLKDIFHVAGLTTAAGARGFADVVPREDAVAVTRLRW